MQRSNPDFLYQKVEVHAKTITFKPMSNFWEDQFKSKEEMWGMTPTDSAQFALKFFQKKGLNKILIPGIGYGRNAIDFSKNGFDVTGIEISKSAIELAEKNYKDAFKIHHGSVLSMPFDAEEYDGIFCHALIHLLKADERVKFIADCFRQLRSGGYLIFTAISIEDASFGKGEKRNENQFLTPHGIEMFFYQEESIVQEFGPYGLQNYKEITEPATIVKGKPFQVLWRITCKKW